MSILVIRAHKRFAVLRKASLCNPGTRAREGLLIELSLEGCRLSGIPDHTFTTGQIITVLIEGFGKREANVRWAHSGCVGLRFVAPLHTAELTDMVTSCRAPSVAQEVRAYAR